MLHRSLAELSSKQSLRYSSMALGGVGLALPTLVLRDDSAITTCPNKTQTHQSIPLQRGRASIEHEDRLNSIEQELRNAAQEAQDVRIDQDASLLVAHSRLELIDPDTRINRHGLALHVLQSVFRQIEPERAVGMLTAQGAQLGQGAARAT